jgi:hypothetical protein
LGLAILLRSYYAAMRSGSGQKRVASMMRKRNLGA